jgi:COP9 signalosome complex subunit 8
MFELKEKIQLEAIELIGRAYTSIYEDKFAEMTNQLSPERVTETCKNLDWPIQDDLEAGKRLIIPNKSTGGKANSLNSDEILQQLYRLTDFVSFLEN